MISIKPTFIRKFVMSAVAAVLVVLPAMETLAQQIEEITVTARRYEERITDAPVAVAVMDADFLRDNRVETVQDVLELTPGADWDQFAKAQPGLTLRGIRGGAFGNASIEHAVSVVSDGVPITKAFMMTLPVYDQERIEVLRGPQGTTFGRNATLGMMHFIAARPSQDYSAHVEASAGERELLGFNGHIGGAISDTVSGRFAFNYTDTPGPMDDATTGDPKDYAENMSFRAGLLFEPSDSFSAYVKVEYMEDEEFPTIRRHNEPGVEWLTASYDSYIQPADIWDVDLSPDPPGNPWIVERDMINLTAELTWSLSNDVALTSITGYVDGDHYSNSDAFGTPYDIRDQLVWNDADIFSQEFRIDNHGTDNRFRWLAGISYLTDEEHRIELNEAEPLRDNCNAVDPSACPRNSILYTEGVNSTDAFGIFGEITYDISDALTLAVGGRYSEDSRDLVFSTWGWGSAGGLGGIGLDNPDPTMDCNAIIESGATPGQCGTEENPVGFFDGVVSGDWDNFSPRVSLSWAVNDTNNLYVLYSEGFKGGGFQQDARWLEALSLVLEPEEATNLEFGWKGQTDRMIWAVTLFMQEQTDVHTGNLVAIGSSQSNLLVNAKGVENTGLELEGTFALTENFQFGGTVAWYDPKFKSGTIINGQQQADGTITGGEDVSGTMPSYNVDFAYYLFAEYNWQLSGGSMIRLRGDVKHRNETWGQNGANNRAGLNLAGTGFMYQKPSITKPGFVAEWISAEGEMSFSVWGRNLDDEADPVNYGPGFGYVYLNGATVDGSPLVRSRATGLTGRRQIGATFRYNFN